MPLPLENARKSSGDSPWHITWRLDKGYRFTAFSPGGRGETVTLGSGWGQRDHRNTDRGATLPYVVRTVERGGLTQFISVFAGEPKDRPLVKTVRRLPLPPGSPADAVAIEIQTVDGPDVVVSMLSPAPVKLSTSAGELVTDGRVAVVLVANGKPSSASLIGGTRLAMADVSLSCAQHDYRGKLLGAAGADGQSWFTVDGELPGSVDLVGQTLLLQDGTLCRAYPIRQVKPDGSRTRIYTKLAGAGFEAREGETWEFVPSVSWQRP